jgi:putative glutamine amidotransferase
MKSAALCYRDEARVLPYADALRLAGIEPVFVTPDRPLDSLINIEGLLLSGGTDLDPQLYGQAIDPRSDQPDRERDALEQRLLREALEADLPVLAICRGMQLFNVTHPGGTLVQDIEGHRIPNRGTHPAEVYRGTRLAEIFGEGVHTVNSRHHQAVDRLGQGLVISAKSPEGVIEGLERPDRRFAIAVQWHPEDQMPEQRRLFEAFRGAL